MQHRITRGFLDRCEEENLAFSGAIQPQGALVCVQAEGMITHASENLNHFLPANNQRLPEPIRHFLPMLDLSVGSRMHRQITLEDKILDLIFSRTCNQSVLIDILDARAAREVPRYQKPPPITAFADESVMVATRKALLHWISAVTGFQRVMYYQFLPDGEGVVCEEVLSGDSKGSYLGLHFPASDIPMIARQLYLKAPWRTIIDSAADSVAVYSTATDSDLITGADTPDLTYATLRSVSPVHAVYMQNMGDRAAFTLPVAQTDTLDALISCHSPEPGFLPPELQETISSQCRQFSAMLREFRTRQSVRTLDEFSYITRDLKQQLSELRSDDRWHYLADWLVQTFDCQGAALICSGELQAFGQTPDPEAALRIDRWFCQRDKDLVFITDHIADLFPDNPPLSEIAGFAAIKLLSGQDIQLCIYLYREEAVQQVRWGGNPDKPVEQHDGELGISPRRSFSQWLEKKVGHSRCWESNSRFRLLHLRTALQSSGLIVPESI